VSYIIILDYGAGNLQSAAKAVEQVASASDHVQVTSDPEAVASASHIILPGVGAFADCMAGLQALPGMVDALKEAVLVKQKPFLGICVGMQLLASKGYEHGVHEGLSWLDAEVHPLVSTDPEIKIPHMGWNTLHLRTRNHPLLKDIPDESHAYFVHSYAMRCKDKSNILATTDHGQEIVAVVGKGNIFGTQFHPEKSQEMGLKLLSNFIWL
jgi:glutamine amidotransferase